MFVLQAVKDFIVRSFKYPKSFNWGYPVFFAGIGASAAFLLLKLLFSGSFPFSSTSLIGCAVIVLVLVMSAFFVPAVLLAEKGGLDIAGRYTGIGALILSFLSGAPVYLIKASLHNLSVVLWLRMGGSIIFPAAFPPSFSSGVLTSPKTSVLPLYATWNSPKVFLKKASRISATKSAGTVE